MIQKPDKLPAGHCKRRIGVLGNPFVFLQVFYTDPPVLPAVSLENLRHFPILRIRICKTQFPERKRLASHRLDHLAEKFRRRPENRNGNAEYTGRFLAPGEILPCQRLFSLTLQFLRLPGTVGNLLRLHPLRQAHQKLLQPEVLQISESLLYIIWFQFF